MHRRAEKSTPLTGIKFTACRFSWMIFCKLFPGVCKVGKKPQNFFENKLLPLPEPGPPKNKKIKLPTRQINKKLTYR